MSGYASNLMESIENKLQSVLGTTYTHPTLGNITLTYVSGGYPADLKEYKNSLPLIILDHQNRPRPVQRDIGGARTYTDLIYIHVIAGGLGDDTANERMKLDLTDKILFGFDLKTFTFTNYDSNAAEGIYHTEIQEVPRISTDQVSVFEQHHSEMLMTVTADILN